MECEIDGEWRRDGGGRRHGREQGKRKIERKNHKTACLTHLLTGNDTNRACLTNGSGSDSHRLLFSVHNILSLSSQPRPTAKARSIKICLSNLGIIVSSPSPFS